MLYIILTTKIVDLASCHGDSGAPVVFQKTSGTNRKSIIAGVSSRLFKRASEPCGIQRISQEMIVKTTHFGVREWIEQYANVQKVNV